MESGRMLKDSQIIVLGVCIAAATIVSSVILSQGFLKVMKFTREVITVTGSAQKDIKSDRISWEGYFSRRELDLKTAYTNLKVDLEKALEYLKTKDVADTEIKVLPVETHTLYKKNEKGYDTNEIEGYRLIQGIIIRSDEVDKIERVSRESTELIDDSVQFESNAPKYFYAKLDELKVEMLARATENAKLRAGNMARSTGNKIGVIRSARMGVFQITPLNSTEVSDWGVNDETSLEKTVTAVVNVSFAIE